MPGRIFSRSFTQAILDRSREILLLSDTHGYTPTGLESSTTSQFHLHLPEVWPPAQYLIDVGLGPALSRRLSSTYMDFVARYRETCQSHFDRATHGGGHLTEHHREVFIILFKRMIQALGSQLVSIARVWLCRAGAPHATVRPERVDASTIVISKAPRNAKPTITQIRVDDVAKVEIIARLGLKATHLASDRVGFNRFVSFYTSNQALSDGDKLQRRRDFATGKSVRTNTCFIHRCSRISPNGM